MAQIPFISMYNLTSLSKPTVAGLNAHKDWPVKVFLIVKIPMEFFRKKNNIYLKVKWKIIITPLKIIWCTEK